jgi:hypothetical protein
MGISACYLDPRSPIAGTIVFLSAAQSALAMFIGLGQWDNIVKSDARCTLYLNK